MVAIIRGGKGAEVLNHNDLLDMPDVAGTNSDHDVRYIQATGDTMTGTLSGTSLYLTSPNYPVGLIERTSTETATIRTSFESLHTTTGDAGNGFGSDVSFAIKDSSGIKNDLGTIGMARDRNDDTTGQVVLNIRKAGNYGNRWICDADGNSNQAGIAYATNFASKFISGVTLLSGTQSTTVTGINTTFSNYYFGDISATSGASVAMDNKYVNVTGDTMTGCLNLVNTVNENAVQGLNSVGAPGNLILSGSSVTLNISTAEGLTYSSAISASTGNVVIGSTLKPYWDWTVAPLDLGSSTKRWAHAYISAIADGTIDLEIGDLKAAYDHSKLSYLDAHGSNTLSSINVKFISGVSVISGVATTMSGINRVNNVIFDGGGGLSGTIINAGSQLQVGTRSLSATGAGAEGAALIGTDTKTNLNNATDVETALTYLDTNIVAGTMYYREMLWAEETLAMNTATSGGKQWSYGNGDVGQDGVIMPYAGTVVAMSIQSVVSTTTNGKVDIMQNGAAAGGEYHIHSPGVGNTGTYVIFGTPLDFAAGDELGFITTTSDANTSQTRVAMWVQYSLGAITGFKGDTGATGADGPVQYYNDPTTDDLLIKTRGTDADTIEQTGITCTDTNNLSGIGTIGCGTIISSGALITTGTIWRHRDGGIDTYSTNQSAGAVALGDVVSLKTNTTFQDIATATREGDMMGVAQETIALAAAGWIRVYGWTTCKAAVGTAAGILENGSTIKTARHGLLWLEQGYQLGWCATSVAGGYVTAFINSTPIIPTIPIPAVAEPP